MSQDRSILVPARASTIIASFALALFLDFLPWRDLRLVPDFVALVLTFWCVRQPRLVGLGVGWTLGLLADAGNGVLLGQHALAYSLLAFLSVWMSRRILWFGPMLQSLHIALILRHYDTDRLNLEDASVRAVESARQVVKKELPFHDTFEVIANAFALLLVHGTVYPRDFLFI